MIEEAGGRRPEKELTLRHLALPQRLWAGHHVPRLRVSPARRSRTVPTPTCRARGPVHKPSVVVPGIPAGELTLFARRVPRRIPWDQPRWRGPLWTMGPHRPALHVNFSNRIGLLKENEFIFASASRPSMGRSRFRSKHLFGGDSDRDTFWRRFRSRHLLEAIPDETPF